MIEKRGAADWCRVWLRVIPEERPHL